MMLLIPILLSFFTLANASKFLSCSGVYGPNYSSRLNPFINVTLEPITTDLNYSTLIFHYVDIKKSNIPDMEKFEFSNELKICDEQAIQDRKCKELNKFIVDYSESESQILNEVLSLKGRSFLEYPVKETGFYCVYIQTNSDHEVLSEIDVQFQQPYGYLSQSDILWFTILSTIQLPVVSVLLLGIAGRFAYVKMFQKWDASLIQRGIFHYTYLVYLKTFFQFLRLWLINNVNVQTSNGAAVASLLLVTAVDLVDSITWGLILVVSNGFGTIYDMKTFPKTRKKKILIFMAVNFLLRVSVINNLTSNITVLNQSTTEGASGSIQVIITIIGFVWVVRSFYKTTKEISTYFDLTTSRLFKRSGLVIVIVPIMINLLSVVLLISHFLRKYKDTNTIDPVDFAETSWYDSVYSKVLILPNIANFVVIIILMFLWDNIDSQSVDEDNVAEFGAPAVGEVALNKNDDESNETL